MVNDAGDVVVANANAAGNSIVSSVSYVLPDYVRNLTLTGSGDLTATGNELDNIITANSGNDILIGGGGNDTLIAGSGYDRMFAGSGNTTFQIDPNTVSSDLIGGAGTPDFLNVYYWAMGINDWQGSYQHAGMYYMDWGQNNGWFSDAQTMLDALYNGDWGGEIEQQVQLAIDYGYVTFYPPLPVLFSAIDTYGLQPDAYYAVTMYR